MQAVTVNGKIDLQKALVCLKQNKLSGYCQVSCGRTVKAFSGVQNFVLKEPFKCFMNKELSSHSAS